MRERRGGGGRSRAAQYLRGQRDVRDLRAAAGAGRDQPRTGFLADVRATFRLVRAWVRGDYRDVRLRSVLAFLTGLVYFLSPVDLIPDVLALVGLTDDAVVVALVFGVVRQELEGFRRWERGPSPTRAGQAITSGDGPPGR